MDSRPELVWNDEFGVKSIDKNKWSFNAKMWVGDILNTENEENVRFEDGELIFNTLPGSDKDNADIKFTANASLITSDKMCFTYGYPEMRACLPYKWGAWPSFWAQSKAEYRTVDYMTEVDFFEVFGKRDSLSSGLHKWDSLGRNNLGSAGAGDYKFEDYKDLDSECYMYGFGWGENSMSFYVDGRCMDIVI